MAQVLVDLLPADPVITGKNDFRNAAAGPLESESKDVQGTNAAGTDWPDICSVTHLARTSEKGVYTRTLSASDWVVHRPPWENRPDYRSPQVIPSSTCRRWTRTGLLERALANIMENSVM